MQLKKLPILHLSLVEKYRIGTVLQSFMAIVMKNRFRTDVTKVSVWVACFGSVTVSEILFRTGKVQIGFFRLSCSDFIRSQEIGIMFVSCVNSELMKMLLTW